MACTCTCTYRADHDGLHGAESSSRSEEKSEGSLEQHGDWIIVMSFVLGIFVSKQLEMIDFRFMIAVPSFLFGPAGVERLTSNLG